MTQSASVLTSRPVRITIDVLFLVLAGYLLISDYDHHHWFGVVLWSVLTVFWIAMIPLDLMRTRR